MKNLVYPLCVGVVCILVGCSSSVDEQSLFRFEFAPDQVSLYYDDNHITSYLFADSLQKQVFYPLKSLSGFEFTRGYPLNEKSGERTDHLHHIGLWFTYGEVNGVDFWTSTWENYDGVNPRHGKITHHSVEVRLQDEKAVFENIAFWKTVEDDTLLSEKSVNHIYFQDDHLIFDRITRLLAQRDIHFEDSKEGMFGIRVAKNLEEHPADTTQGGIYVNSEGQKGTDVFGRQAEWVMLKSRSAERSASILFIDHPDNPGYPAHWMARGYGLFAVNPLGKSAYTKGRDSLNLSLSKGDSVRFQYRMVFSDRNHLSESSMEVFLDQFMKD